MRVGEEHTDYLESLEDNNLTSISVSYRVLNDICGIQNLHHLAN